MSSDIAATERLGTAASSSPPVAANLDSPVRTWAILLLLSVGVMISFIDRTSLSAAMAVEDFKVSFHLSDIDRGWINSAFFWTYALLQIPMGWIVDRYGVKWPFAICFALWCIASAATGLATGFLGLMIIRLAVGGAEAIGVPASWRWIRNNFAEGQSGTAVGVYLLGAKIGPAVAPALVVWLIGISDWQTMFFVTGIGGLLWLVPWIVLVRNDRPTKVVDTQRQAQASALPVRRLLKSPVVWGAMVVNFCYNYFTFYCMTWMPSYLVEQRGLSLGSMGLYTFFSFGGIALVAVLAGAVAVRLIARGSDPVFTRKAFTLAGFLLASTVIMGAHTSSLEAALFWNVASLSGLGLATANYMTLCRLTLIPKGSVGIVAGLQQVATSLAGIIAPLLTGWLLQISGSYTLPIDTIFVFLATGAATTAFVLKEKWAPREDAV